VSEESQSRSDVTRIAVAGAAGRMGATIIETCRDLADIVVTVALEHPGHPMIGKSMDTCPGNIETGKGIHCQADLELAADDFDVLIDFTRPEATLNNVEVCRRHGKRIVIGTTGLTSEDKDRIQDAASVTGIVLAPNMSIGVNLCFTLLETAARILGQEFDIEIIEAHHRHKLDAPSGTALRMGEVIADTLGRDLSQCAIYGRQGQTGERSSETIGFATIRAGDIVGDHTVMFAAPGERVEISHKASSRRTFAAGALRAAKWIVQQPFGLFDMQDVLGLRTRDS